MISKLLSGVIDAIRYDGIPPKVSKMPHKTNSRPGGLTPKQLAWCDAKLGNGVFEKAREQAEAARKIEPK